MQLGSGSSSNIERNLAERSRRKHMKGLYSTLASLILPQNSKETPPPLHRLLDEANTHVKHLQQRIHELQRRKELLKCDDINVIQDKRTAARLISPVIDLKILDSTLEVNLIIGSDKNSMLREVISVLEEEGAQVVNVSYSAVGDRIFYTIHAQPIISRIGIEISNVDEKLKKLVLLEPMITMTATAAGM